MNMKKEIYGGRYIIDDSGIIYSTWRGRVRPLSQCVVKGYLKVGIVDEDGNHKTKSVHRIIAETFIPNPLRLPQVNHIDGNKLNNDVKNLEWVTAKQNTNHAQKLGLRSSFHLVLCTECKKMRPHHSKQMCELCYDKIKKRESRKSNAYKPSKGELTNCLVCGETRVHHARGLCQPCYDRLKKQNALKKYPRKTLPSYSMITCCACGQEKIHRAKNMCVTCYGRYLRERTA
jgi:hypothetical protein